MNNLSNNSEPALTPIKKAIAGHVIVFYFNIESGLFKRWSYPYYLSKTSRLMFRHGPGLFEGMRPENLGQFQYDCGACYMVTLNEDYDKNKAHFLRCVTRAIYRKQKESK